MTTSKPTTKILAIGTINPGVDPARLFAILPNEVRDTVDLYLNGKIDQWYSQQERRGVVKGVWANIPPKCNRNNAICFSPYLYRARNLIERFFNKIKQCRRIATRYDKLAANYLAFVKLAAIREGDI